MATLTINNAAALQKTKIDKSLGVWQLGKLVVTDDEYVWSIDAFEPLYELRINRNVRSGLVRVVVWDMQGDKEARSGYIPLKEMQSVSDFRRAMESDWIH